MLLFIHGQCALFPLSLCWFPVHWLGSHMWRNVWWETFSQPLTVFMRWLQMENALVCFRCTAEKVLSVQCYIHTEMSRISSFPRDVSSSCIGFNRKDCIYFGHDFMPRGLAFFWIKSLLSTKQHMQHVSRNPSPMYTNIGKIHSSQNQLQLFLLILTMNRNK